jgi:hypothetical protein
MTAHANKYSIRRRWLLLAVILTGLSGCDNVSWGGIDMRLEGPAEDTVVAPEGLTDEATEPGLPDLPTEPILLAGSRAGATASLTVVGMVRGDRLDAFPSDEELPGFHDHFARTLLAPGTELVLFSHGARVGRMTVSETETDTRFCVPRPTVSGVVELVPGAEGAESILALLDPAATDRPFDAFRPVEHTYDQRIASLNLASGAIQRSGAPWPPSLLESRADVQALQIPGREEPSIAATFLFGDRLEVVPAERGNAYSLFVMGSPRQNGYQTDFVWYRRVDRDGKGAARYFGHMDWDGDGDSEVLLEVLGGESRWFAGVAQRNDSWVRTFEDPCGRTDG